MEAVANEFLDEAASNGEHFETIRDVVTAKLRILARQEKYEDYLALAHRQRFMMEYACMLALIGRFEEAETVGLEHLTVQNEILALAKQLNEQGALEETLRVAEYGLGLAEDEHPYRSSDLAPWLSTLAEQQHRPELALNAAVAAFFSKSHMDRYQRVQTL